MWYSSLVIWEDAPPDITEFIYLRDVADFVT